jgi:hypothetical protein
MYLIDHLKSVFRLPAQGDKLISIGNPPHRRKPLHGTAREQPRHSGATGKDQSTGSRRVISTSGIPSGNFFHRLVV